MNIPPLNIKILKSMSNGQVYDVVTEEEFCKNSESYADRSDVAVMKKYNGQDIILPIKKSNVMMTPGIYDSGPIYFTVYPDQSAMDKYIPKQLVEMNNLMDIQEIIKAGEATRKLDEAFITTPDNITQISINEEDQQEMKCLKMALNAKKIDLDKYANRFGDNFPNDKRQLKNHSITLNIIKRFCNNCDMDAILTLKDKDPDVPNPMGKEITVSLTDGFVDEEEEE